MIDDQLVPTEQVSLEKLDHETSSIFDYGGEDEQLCDLVVGVGNREEVPLISNEDETVNPAKKDLFLEELTQIDELYLRIETEIQ